MKKIIIAMLLSSGTVFAICCNSSRVFAMQSTYSQQNPQQNLQENTQQNLKENKQQDSQQKLQESMLQNSQESTQQSLQESTQQSLQESTQQNLKENKQQDSQQNSTQTKSDNNYTDWQKYMFDLASGKSYKCPPPNPKNQTQDPQQNLQENTQQNLKENKQTRLITKSARKHTTKPTRKYETKSKKNKQQDLKQKLQKLLQIKNCNCISYEYLQDFFNFGKLLINILKKIDPSLAQTYNNHVRSFINYENAIKQIKQQLKEQLTKDSSIFQNIINNLNKLKEQLKNQQPIDSLDCIQNIIIKNRDPIGFLQNIINDIEELKNQKTYTQQEEIFRNCLIDEILPSIKAFKKFCQVQISLNQKLRQNSQESTKQNLACGKYANDIYVNHLCTLDLHQQQMIQKLEQKTDEDSQRNLTLILRGKEECSPINIIPSPPEIPRQNSLFNIIPNPPENPQQNLQENKQQSQQQSTLQNSQESTKQSLQENKQQSQQQNSTQTKSDNNNTDWQKYIFDLASGKSYKCPPPNPKNQTQDPQSQTQNPQPNPQQNPPKAQ